MLCDYLKCTIINSVNIIISMSDLQNKIKEISIKYSDLKKSDVEARKLQLCSQIINLCVAAEKQLDKQSNRSQNFRRARQIDDIKSKVIALSQSYHKQKISKAKSAVSFEDNDNINIVNINNKGERLTEEQMSKKIVRTIVEQQMSAKNMKASHEQLQKIAIKMQQNLMVMEEIKKMIQDQGNNLDLIQDNIIKTYQEVEESNKQLTEAAQIKLKSRLSKIRMGFSGIIGTIGFAIMGIPGAILGLVGGFKLSKFGRKVS